MISMTQSDIRRDFRNERERRHRKEHPAIFVRVSPDERERIKAAAQASGLSLTAWCRQVLLKQLEAE